MGTEARNIRAVVEYCGKNYHGWQFQKNAVSVQEMIEKAIASLSGESVRILAAGRTDAGVHARGQVVNFRIRSNMPIRNIEQGVNAYLPPDIALRSVEEVDETFHARFSARRRTYLYTICTRRTALRADYCWQVFRNLDINCLNKLASLLIGEHDFGAFSRIEVHSKTKICTIMESEWTNDGDFWFYQITANRFLHGMVRTIVGTMIDVASGRFTVEEFNEIFVSMDRRRAGRAAPPQGLVLEKVVY